MELQDAINQRHSIRQFTDKPVEKKIILNFKNKLATGLK